MKKIENVTLISPLDSFLSYGLRLVSSYLQKKQINVKMIFLPSYTEMWQLFFKQEYSQFSANALREINEVVSGSDLVGITMMTMDKNRVSALCRSLKKINKKIILGGIHPTIFPEDALELADIVNIGEGFESVVELCENPENKLIENIWFKENGQILKNKVRPAINNIDELPFPDFNFRNHYILSKGHILKMDDPIQQKMMGVIYHQFATLGCPFSCTYCVNDVYKELSSNYQRFRPHSVDYIIAEIKQGLSVFPKIQYVNFPDDGFIAMSEDEIAGFAEKYKKEIGLPFSIMGIIPDFVTQRKIDLLYGAGLKRIRMGIQSFHKPTLELYKRSRNTEKVFEVNGIFQAKKGMVFPYYDIIMDNPFVEDEKATLETIQNLLKLKGKYTLFLYSLRLYPGTELYYKGQEAKFQSRLYEDSYLDFNNYLLNYILTVIQATGNRFFAEILLFFYRSFGNLRVPKVFFSINKILFMIRCGFEHIRKKDISGLPVFVLRFIGFKKKK